jgi:hypothetical protein
MVVQKINDTNDTKMERKKEKKDYHAIITFKFTVPGHVSFDA